MRTGQQYTVRALLAITFVAGAACALVLSVRERQPANPLESHPAWADVTASNSAMILEYRPDAAVGNFPRSIARVHFLGKGELEYQVRIVHNGLADPVLPLVQIDSPRGRTATCEIALGEADLNLIDANSGLRCTFALPSAVRNDAGVGGTTTIDRGLSILLLSFVPADGADSGVQVWAHCSSTH